MKEKDDKNDTELFSYLSTDPEIAKKNRSEINNKCDDHDNEHYDYVDVDDVDVDVDVDDDDDDDDDDDEKENYYLKYKREIKLFIAALALISASILVSPFFKEVNTHSEKYSYVVVDSIDWVDKSDFCQGMRKSDVNSNVYYFKSKGSEVNLNLPILKGYRWATTTEYESLMPSNYSKVYYDKCGYSGFPISKNGSRQKNFYFSDSYETGKSVNASGREGKTERVRDADVNSFAGYVFIKT